MSEAAWKMNSGQQDYTAGSALSAGTVLQLNDGRAAVLKTDLASGDKGAVYTEGILDFTCGTSVTFSAGDAVWWDADGDTAITGSGAAADFLLGTAVEAKTSGQLVVRVDLNVEAGAPTSGVLDGAGTSAAPFTMVGDGQTAYSLYITSASTADSNRAIYARLYLTGAGGGGESARLFATGSGVGLTALRGAHISANISGSGTITGEMQAVKATLHVPDSTLGGTCAPVAANIYADGTSADASNLAFIRTILDGASASGLADIPLISMDGLTAGTGNTLEAVASKTLTTTHFIKVNVDGVGTRYFPIGTIA